MPIGTDRLRCLKQMLELIQIGIWIGIINQCIEIVHGVPKGHLLLLKLQKFLFLFHHKVVGLVSVIEAVKLPNSIHPLRVMVISIILLGFGLFVLRLRIAYQQIIFPIFNRVERSGFRFGKLRFHEYIDYRGI
jgi:hypothetical protein